ncbi:nucleotidyltransferase domain-containing protein [Nonomuraea mangrovi]|uniref:Nucleotidyltransferase domain-containing protein n=1 Tax=Nonomuraea mangrovi TaxID=2316207 RepID=A0ABW4T531_9ACTN
MDDMRLRELAGRLAGVPGVVGVVLGGSRARGTHRPDSDIDLGLYYRGSLDVEALRALALEVSGQSVEVTAPGGWGPWVDGGGWLTVEGWRVDWIYRDLDRVRAVWADCLRGRYEVGVQAGHPLGFYSHAYAGEVAMCKVFADPTGEIGELKAATQGYPEPLGRTLVEGLWEADFAVQLARYGVKGDDPAYTAGCLFRAVGVACHALHGRAGRWLINEKGMVASAARLEIAPDGFAERVAAVFAQGSVDGAAELVGEVRALTG